MGHLPRQVLDGRLCVRRNDITDCVEGRTWEVVDWIPRLSLAIPSKCETSLGYRRPCLRERETETEKILRDTSSYEKIDQARH